MNSVSGSDWIWLTTRLAIYARDGGRCLACGADSILSLDHVRPRSQGGSNRPENLITLCVTCNRDRWHRPLATWCPRVAKLARSLTRRKLDRASARELAANMRPSRFSPQRERRPSSDIIEGVPF